MTVMNEISEAVLEKVRAEAQDLVNDAKTKGTEAISRAREQQAARQQEEKSRMLEKARGEATRTLAQSSIRARQELLKAKKDVVEGIVDRVKKSLTESAGDPPIRQPPIKCALAIDTLPGSRRSTVISSSTRSASAASMKNVRQPAGRWLTGPSPWRSRPGPAPIRRAPPPALPAPTPRKGRS